MKIPRFNSMLAAGVAATAVVLAAGEAAAQQPAAPESYRIGYVNPERVKREARGFLQAQQVLDAEFQKRNQEIAGDEERLRAMAVALDKDSAILSAAERQKRERAAGDLQRDIERRKRTYTEEFNQRREEVQKQVAEKADATIRRVAEQEKLDAVFVEAAYAAPHIDITDKVIKALDAAR
jgi:outer membrane protein